MKRLSFLCLCLSFFAGQLAFAAGGGGESSDTVQPTFTQNGNTWRIVTTSATSTLTLLSSTPANATMITAGTVSLGINIYRERFIVNTCTCAALSLYPTNTGFTQFSTTASIVLSSAPASVVNVLTLNNSRYFYHQDNIYGIWDTGAAGGGVGPTPGCGGGAIIMEEYYSGSQDPTKRR